MDKKNIFASIVLGTKTSLDQERSVIPQISDKGGGVFPKT